MELAFSARERTGYRQIQPSEFAICFCFSCVVIRLKSFFKLSNGFRRATRGEIIKPFWKRAVAMLQPHLLRTTAKRQSGLCKVRQHWANRSLPVGRFSCHCGSAIRGMDQIILWRLRESRSDQRIRECVGKALRKHWKKPKLGLNSMASCGVARYHSQVSSHSTGA